MKEYYFYNGRSITVYTAEGTFTFLKDNNLERFNQVHTLCLEGKFDEIAELTLSPKAVNAYCAGSQLSISPEGIATIDDEVLPSALSEVIVNLYKEGAPIDCFVNFWNKLKLNPFATTVERLYYHIDKFNITLLPDGNLLMYKVVKRTENPNVFIDIWSQTIRQSVGDTIEVPYNKVDNRNEVSCSYGLHSCEWDYVPMYRSAMSGVDVVINVSVNPKDICAIPYGNISKIRGRCYTILEENTQLTEIRQAYYNNQVELESSYEDDEDAYNEEWDDVEDDNDEDY